MLRIPSNLSVSQERGEVMKINIHEIPPQGVTLEETISGEILDVDRPDIEVDGPVRVKAQVQRKKDGVRIGLEIEAGIHITCGRCLDYIEKNITRQSEVFKPVKEDKVIDLIQIAREELVLGFPATALCREDCRGLCPVCGRNRNLRQCNCPEDSRVSQNIKIE